MASLLREVSRQSQPLAAHLEEARALRFREGVLTIEVEAHDRWLRDALERRRNSQIMNDAVSTIWGEGAGWAVQSSTAPRHGSPGSTLPPTHLLSGNPTVQAVVDIFGATVESLEDTRSPEED